MRIIDTSTQNHCQETTLDSDHAMDMISFAAKWPTTPIAFFLLYSFAFCKCLDEHPSRRWRMIPFILVPVWLSYATMQNLPQGVSSLWGLGIFVHVLHTTMLLYIDKVQLPVEFLSQMSERERFLRKYRLWVDPQGVYYHTVHELPSIVKQSRSEPGSLGRFVLVRLLLLLLYAIITAMVMLGMGVIYAPIDPREFSMPSGFAHRLLAGPGNLRALALRVGITIYWLWATFAFLSGANIVLSLIFVGLGFDRPSDWPHIFGSPLAAYDIRRFWKLYWHQTAIPSFRKFTCFAIGKLPMAGYVRQLLTIFGIFVLSGINHAMCSWWLDDLFFLDEFWFFLAMFGVCALETCVGRIWMKHGRELAKKKMPTRERKLLGYAWVGIVLVWMVPAWQYPKIQHALERQLNHVEA